MRLFTAMLCRFFIQCLCLAAVMALPGFGALAGSADDGFPAMVSDRTAVERVYYLHREGVKPPFEQVLSRADVVKLVERDLARANVLKTAYGVEITDADISAEAQRIDHATRAPDILADLKHALGDDPVRFGHVVVKPILVERRLRELYQNDGAIHATMRARVEQLRSQLLALRQEHAGVDQLLASLRSGGEVTENSWDLKALAKDDSATTKPARTAAHSASYSVDATAQWIQSGNGEKAGPTPGLELQALLQDQLHHAGDVSAVVETDSAFLLFVARDRTDPVLRTATLRVPKENYDSWLARQMKSPPTISP